MVFNVAERVAQVRIMKAKIKEMEDEFDERIKPFEDWMDAAETELLQYLNDSGQKSAATAHGTVYWSERVSFRVADKDEFKRHIIGSEQWELSTFAAATTACEDFTQVNGHTPPGITRHAERKAHVIAPAKPRVRKPKSQEAAQENDIEEMTSGQ